MFLDIDDVLCLNAPYGGYDAILVLRGRHPNPSRVYEKLFAARPRRVLADVHGQMGGQIRYVISSTWREHFTREELLGVLSAGGLDFVAEAMLEDACWCTPLSGKEVTRAADIANWLAQHHRGEAFLILDDKFSGRSLEDALYDSNHPFASRVVLCDEYVGLLAEHAAFMVNALRRPAVTDFSRQSVPG